MNFGDISSAVYKQCLTMLIEGKDEEAKSIIDSFSSYVARSDILTRQFIIYKTIKELKADTKSQAKANINTTFNLMSEISCEDLSLSLKLLAKKYNVSNAPAIPIHKHISECMIAKMSKGAIVDLQKLFESTNKLISYVLTDKPDLAGNLVAEANKRKDEKKDLKYVKPWQVLDIAIKKFNAKFGNMSPADKKLLISLKNDRELAKLYAENLNKAKSQFAKLKPDIDTDLLEKLVIVVEKLETSEPNIDTVLELIELNTVMKDVI